MTDADSSPPQLVVRTRMRPDRFQRAGKRRGYCVRRYRGCQPLPRKQEARDLTFPLFAGDGPANVETMVRINPLSTPDGLRDTLALRCAAPPRALMLAAGSAAEIRLRDELLQGSCADIRFHDH